MIFRLPAPNDPIDQGDIIDGCPIVQIVDYSLENLTSPKVACSRHPVVVLTQSCDLANQKTQRVTVAVVHNAQFLVEQKVVQAVNVRGPIRGGRVFGWYFLPRAPEFSLEVSIADLRQLFTIPLEVLRTLCNLRLRKARIQPLYREHLAKHFADTYSRIGLPAPYETD